jgi:hypothetical protein
VLQVWKESRWSGRETWVKGIRGLQRHHIQHRRRFAVLRLDRVVQSTVCTCTPNPYCTHFSLIVDPCAGRFRTSQLKQHHAMLAFASGTSSSNTWISSWSSDSYTSSQPRPSPSRNSDLAPSPLASRYRIWGARGTQLRLHHRTTHFNLGHSPGPARGRPRQEL